MLMFNPFFLFQDLGYKLTLPCSFVYNQVSHICWIGIYVHVWSAVDHKHLTTPDF